MHPDYNYVVQTLQEVNTLNRFLRSHSNGKWDEQHLTIYDFIFVPSDFLISFCVVLIFTGSDEESMEQ